MKTTIKKWGINGEGIAYKDRKPVFITGAMPNEFIEYSVVKEFKNYSIGKLEKIIKSSNSRRKMLCAYADRCGGCSLMHVQYKAQCKMKEQFLKESLKKYAKLNISLDPIVKNMDSLAYRNACKLPLSMQNGKIVSGMYEKDSNEFVEISRCLIHSKTLEKVRQTIVSILQENQCRAYDKRKKMGYRTLVLKEFDEKVQVIFVTGKDKINEKIIQLVEEIEEVESIWQSIKVQDSPEVFGDQMIHLALNKNIIVPLDKMTLSLLPKSFFQLNTKQAVQLYNTVHEWMPKSKCIVEAYSGIGAMSLYCHDKADEVIGIEFVEDAVCNAKENALENNIENVKFICGDAAKKLKDILLHKEVDSLIVDPPRTGLNSEMLNCIISSSIKNIIYVSCNPSTLSKDLAVLSKNYNVEKVRPFDMFSQTQHVETVVLLSKLKTKKHINIELRTDEFDLTASESKATYAKIKQYVLEKHGIKVSSLNIAQIKQKCGIKERDNYNLSKKENVKQPQCTVEKEKAIMDAFRHFQMI